jgi:hypothetical protein
MQFGLAQMLEALAAFATKVLAPERVTLAGEIPNSRRFAKHLVMYQFESHAKISPCFFLKEAHFMPNAYPRKQTKIE